MTAYPKKDLYNKYLQEQASEAFHYECINEESYKNILEKHTHELYTPNYFIRVGLALLSIVAVVLSLALFWLITSADSETAVTMLMIFFAIICYGFLELMVKQKKYYNAGIDNILLVMILVFIVSAMFFNESNNSHEISVFIALLICTWLAIRFVDACMAVLAFASLIWFFFLVYTRLGTFGKMTASFALMLLCAAVFIAARNFIKKHNNVIYKNCLQWIILIALLCFYAAGNYFVVNELSLEMFNAPIALGFIFWILTFVVPLFYIIYGLIKRENIFYRTGIVLLIISVLTVRYYHAVMPAEIAMTVFGSVIIILSFALIKYLKQPVKGYTFENIDHTDKNILNAEAVIIAQVFGKKVMPQSDHFKFGGGSSGGAGATGNY